MSNVTLSINDEILKKGRDYAKCHGTSLNQMIRDLLEKSVSQGSTDWLDACFKKMDSLKLKPTAKSWRREDLYDV